ncbi:MAG: glycoside hydrolase family 2 protein [Blautia sp.]|nr:glycoside hydrolase family 2 protein [Blautia sp.]
MRKRFLHDNWRMREMGSEEWIPAKVPGSVYADLLAAGRMEEPWYRDNELDALARMEKDYCYETFFDMEEGTEEYDEILLTFYGLDTLATVSLNGTIILEADNMHREFRLPVRQLLREKDNQLHICFHSPNRFVRESYDNDPIHATTDCMRGFPRLRKAHCMMGWDWGARLPDAGIWRPVELSGVTKARLAGVYIAQKIEGISEDGVYAKQVTLTLKPEVSAADGALFGGLEERNGKEDLSGCVLQVELGDPAGETILQESFPLSEAVEVTIPEARLWWPHGFGGQPLYRLRASLVSGDGILDTWERRIGFRTLTVDRTPDPWGERFCHVVNGVPVFAMGADYIPEDNILRRVTRDRTERLLRDAVLANHNTVRVWGGGYYPEDWFYDLCDELGLLVWQDFMFACAVYDLTPEFEKSITAEAADNVRRLRHHPSLVLWCGNNEMESFIHDDREGWCRKPSQFSDYVRMYEHILPKVVHEYDPETFYWPSSPSSGGAFDDPNGEDRGDVHYWDVWHGGKPFTEYRKFFFRYLSEFGFQSFPALPTIEAFTLPEDRNVFSYVMEKHQRNNAANGTIMRYMEQTYLYPSDFETFIYASQLLQADAIRYGVEHFRRHRGRCMGTVVWQLNDIMPAASWSSIDYFGRWKALHYFEKRFFAPLLLSCEEESMISQDPNINAEPFRLKKSIRLCVSNETRKARTVQIRWQVRNADGSPAAFRTGQPESSPYAPAESSFVHGSDDRAEPRKMAEDEPRSSGSTCMTVPPLSSAWLPGTELPALDVFRQYVSYELEEDGEIRSSGTVLFAPPKFFRFEDPRISLSVVRRDDGAYILAEAEAYARSVEIYGEEDLLLEDNFFDMNAGSRLVRILRGTPRALKARSVFDIR